MESRTERLMRAAGSREAFAVLRALLEADARTNGLANLTSLSAQTVERTLETLSQASVVSRREGAQGAWFITQWPETFALFNAARVLGVAIQGSEDRLDAQERERFARLEAAGRAKGAAKRGRPRRESDEEG